MLIDSTAQYFIFLLPVFLMVLGILCLTFWYSKKEFTSVFWLGLATASNGLAFFIQSVFAFHLQYQIYWLVMFLYLFNYACFSQAVISRFDLKLNWCWCGTILIICESLVIYYSFYQNNYVVRLIIFSIATLCLLSFYSFKLLKRPNLSDIHRWLKYGFFVCAVIFFGRSMLLIHYSLSEHTALLNFQSTSHWFANQLVILILTLVYTALIIAAHFYEAHLQQQSLLLQAKRQERMHLSQDLHDTLGSSLVRSIGAISNQQHQLSSDQVLSMLKLFRDDLRQVIDHNTHTDETTIPENPTAWAAPIRHRFSQVFEALNINAAWHFDPVWHYTPTAIECVNLRRITEEALTNIIKHSQATQVEVQLILNAQHQLELRIRDNGCGFAVEYMTQQGINVGLKSMQQRVESIGAQLFINSNAQGTQIVIIKA